MHQTFINHVISVVREDPDAIGLAVAGSYIKGEIDEFSDLDLVLVTKTRIAPDLDNMRAYASGLGNLLNAFTGEHVGEHRLLICLYDSPLLHVDIKFLTPDEYHNRVENPVIVWERDHVLSSIQADTAYRFPYPDYQWIEDRFWTWVHYACLKIGRGELFEALDFTAFLRQQVLASLLQIRNGQLPKALRKVERLLPPQDLNSLKSTIAAYDRTSITQSIENCISLYRDLSAQLFPGNIIRRKTTEDAVMAYFEKIKLVVSFPMN